MSNYEKFMSSPITSAKDRILTRLDTDVHVLKRLVDLQSGISAMGALITEENEVVMALVGNGQQQITMLTFMAKALKAKAMVHITESWMIERKLDNQSDEKDLSELNAGEKRVSEFEDRQEVVTWFMKIVDPELAVNGSTEFSFMFPLVEKNGKKYLDTETFADQNKKSREGQNLVTSGTIIEMMRKVSPKS